MIRFPFKVITEKQELYRLGSDFTFDYKSEMGLYFGTSAFIIAHAIK